MLDWLFTPEALIALATLTALELVLGIDNVIFISILASRLPAHQQDVVRRIGVGVAAVSRLLLLFALAWIMGLTAPLFVALGQEISGRDLILIAGGLFLIYKAVNELHQRLEGEEDAKGKAVQATFAGVLLQVFVLDMVFALDSIITAIGMVEDIRIMVVAIVLATALMLLLAKQVHRFVMRHPTVKVLALAFLLMIGMVLIADGFGVKIPKGYVYFAMCFAVFIELLNMRLRKVSAPVRLHEPYADAEKRRDDSPTAD